MCRDSGALRTAPTLSTPTGISRTPRPPFGEALVRATGELSAYRCLVLLGEPGAGKTQIISAHAPLLPPDVGLMPVVQRDLGLYGSEGRAITDLLESAEVRHWCDSGGNLCLVLDAFDEAQTRIPTLARLFCHISASGRRTGCTCGSRAGPLSGRRPSPVSWKRRSARSAHLSCSRSVEPTSRPSCLRRSTRQRSSTLCCRRMLSRWCRRPARSFRWSYASLSTVPGAPSTTSTGAACRPRCSMSRRRVHRRWGLAACEYYKRPEVSGRICCLKCCDVAAAQLACLGE